MLNYINLHVKKISLHRHLRLSADLNNMSWRVRPEELLLEVGKQFSSKINLHQAISDANVSDKLRMSTERAQNVRDLILFII